MKNLFCILSLIFLIQSCATDDPPQLVTIDDRFSLILPSSMTKTDILNEDATLQYQNSMHELYTIVLEDTHAEFGEALKQLGKPNDSIQLYENNLNVFSNILLNYFKEAEMYTELTDMTDTVIHNIPAKIVTFTGESDGTEIYYNIGFYEGKTRFYQIWTWTHWVYKIKNKSKMHDILYSFTELES